ncbi:MAG: sulfur carrier protein ThiS [Spirochaetales bacterium]|nr:sulfur carrier protein ThiS [Spirochaetales bacterium]
MIVFNGKEQDVEPGIKSLSDFVRVTKVEEEGLVVLLDEVVIKREKWDSTEIKDGMAIEFINFVSGG